MSSVTARFAMPPPRWADAVQAIRPDPAKALILTPLGFAPVARRRCARTRGHAWFATRQMTQICRIAGDFGEERGQFLAGCRKLLA